MRLAVIGGGISGLAAAFFARDIATARGTPLAITVFERGARAGGCIETRRQGEFVLEMGADSLATEKIAATQLASRLGLELQPVRDDFRGTCIVRDGRLVRMPDEFRLFAPTSLRALVTSGLFTPGGVLRAALEPFVPRRRGSDDESLAQFVSRRFGREVLERLAQPLLGGIYSGDPSNLSLQATMPHLQAVEAKYGSLVRGMRALQKSAPAGPRLVSLRGGLEALVTALERALPDTIRTNADVVRLERSSQGWKLWFADGAHAEADAVICALPAHAAAGLLQPLQPELARRLASIVYHSIATVTTAYEWRDVPPLPQCTGFVSPSIEHRPVMATTFSNRKYAERTPYGYAVLRAFIGGTEGEPLVFHDDESLTAIVTREFDDLLGIVAQPQFVIVRRWPRALPEYAVGHRENVDAIEGLAASLGVALAGSAYRGVGVADCVRSAETAAASIHNALQSSPNEEFIRS